MGFPKGAFSALSRISISIVLLIFLFRQADTEALIDTVKSSDRGLLLLAFLAFFITYVLGLLRWDMLLKAAKIRLPLKRVIISFAGGTFFNLLLPSAIGGDFVRSIDLSAHTGKPRQIVATVLLDRLSGYLGLMVMAVLALFIGAGSIQAKIILIPMSIIIALSVLATCFLFNSFLFSQTRKALDLIRSSVLKGRFAWHALAKIVESMNNLYQEAHFFKQHKKILAANLALSLLIQAINSAVLYTIALSLGIKSQIIYFFVFLPIINVITILPVSIGGLGLRDAATIYFFTRAGFLRSSALAMSLTSFLFMLIYAGIGGVIYVLTVHHRRLQSD